MKSPTLPLETDRLSLRAFEPGDLDALHAIQSRADVARFLPWAPRSRDEVAERLAARVAETGFVRVQDRMILAVVLRETGAVIGDVNLCWRSETDGLGEIGWVLHPEHHGRGYAAEAAAPLLRFAFDTMGLRRVVACCDARNGASARVAEKLGMRREAHFRRAALVRGEWTDELVYAILDEEWRAGRPCDPRSVVSRWVERFNAADAAGLAALYTPDAVNHQVALAPVVGRAGIEAMFRREFEAVRMVCIVENLFVEGDWAILEWRDPNGLRGSGFFRIRDGLVAFQRGYWDRLSFMQAAGARA